MRLILTVWQLCFIPRNGVKEGKAGDESYFATSKSHTVKRSDCLDARKYSTHILVNRRNSY